MPRVRLLINSVDLSGSLLEPEWADWEVETHAGGEDDVFTFSLLDPTNVITLANLTDVVLEEFADNTNRYFGGKLIDHDEVTEGLGRVINCKALGWAFDLHRTIVNQKFRGKSDQFIITDPTTGIFLGLSAQTVSKDLSDYTVITANIEVGNKNTDIMVFRGDSVRDIMDLFQDWSGFVWGVTPKQVVFYREYSSSISAQQLSDAPDEVTSWPYYGFANFKTSANFVNLIYVYGGFQTLENQIRTYGIGDGADGTKKDFTLPHKWRAKDSETLITVELSDGVGGWDSPLTVGITSEEGSFGVVWNEIGQTLFFAVAPPNTTPSFRVQGNLFDRVTGVAKNQASIDAHGLFEASIKDADLRDEEAAERRARIELNKLTAEAHRISLTTRQPGFIPGDLVLITNSIHSLASYFLITRMVMRPLGATLQEYDLTLSAVAQP